MAADLSTIRKTLEALDREAKALRASIESNRRLREEIAAAPLNKSDVLAIMQGQCDALAAQAPSMFDQQFQMIATRPGKTWSNVYVLPEEGPTLARALLGLMATEFKSALETAILARPENPNAGADWSERVVLLEQLDQAIAADEASLAALRDQVIASGLSWPGKDLYSA